MNSNYNFANISLYECTKNSVLISIWILVLDYCTIKHFALMSSNYNFANISQRERGLFILIRDSFVFM